MKLDLTPFHNPGYLSWPSGPEGRTSGAQRTKRPSSTSRHRQPQKSRSWSFSLFLGATPGRQSGNLWDTAWPWGQLSQTIQPIRVESKRNREFGTLWSESLRATDRIQAAEGCGKQHPPTAGASLLFEQEAHSGRLQVPFQKNQGQIRLILRTWATVGRAAWRLAACGERAQTH